MVMPPEAALSLVHVLGKALGIPHFALSTIIGAANRSAVVLSVWVLVALGVAVIAVVAIKHACLDIALLITLTIVVQLRRASLCTFGRHVRQILAVATVPFAFCGVAFRIAVTITHPL